MIEFVCLAAAMSLLCVLIVLVPLWRRRATTPTADRRREANIEVYRQRCAELDRDAAMQRISEQDAAAEKDALGVRLLSDVDASTSDSPSAAMTTARYSRPWLASVLSVCLIVAGSVATYYWLGDWAALSERDTPNIDQLLVELKTAVAEHPEDRGARLMLAEAQKDQGNYAAAAYNLHRVNQQMVPPDARLLRAEAEMLMAAGGDLSGRAGDLYAQVLIQDPRDINALWYLGLRAAEANQPGQAVGYWNRLLAQDVPPQVRSMVTSRRNALAGDVPGL